jgi:hypothetical protein
MAKKQIKESRRTEAKERRNSGALFIPAGIFIGMGVGFLVNNIPAGLFAGMGLGFLAFGITALIKK